MRKVTGVLSAGLSVVLVSGCTSMMHGEPDFACNEGKNNGVCTSARDVYQNRNLDPITQRAGSSEDRDDQDEDIIIKYVEKNTHPYPVINLDGPIPIRTPAITMRIWVAPWQDDQGDLHVPGLIYTEVEPRKWAVGEGNSKSYLTNGSFFKPLNE